MLKLAALCLLTATTSVLAAGTARVTIAQGEMECITDENIKGVTSCKNIPFAQPPIGNLRFAAPQPPKPWSGLRPAQKFGPGCLTIYSQESFPQPFMIPKTMSEDCLNLNVYTPTLNTSANLPVSVFFYGGNYQLGAGSVPLYDGSTLATPGPISGDPGAPNGQNMVVVTMNYRLNVLGGLYAGGEITGNYQYLDQLESMKWIKKNIKAFGGNPDNLMIWGQSAGAASVTSHMIGPKSWPYFKSAVSLSNPIGLQFNTPQLALKVAAEVLKNVSCPNDGSAEMVKCLRAAPAEQLVAASLSKTSMIPSLFPRDVAQILMPWVPVVDGDTIPSQPIRALASGAYNKVPFVISSVANESNEFTRDVWQKDLSPFEAELLMDLIFGFNKTLDKSVLSFYFPNGIPHVKDTHLLLDPIVTDWLWWAPWTTVGQLMSAITPGQIYQVMFTKFLSGWDTWVYSNPINWYCRTVEKGWPGYTDPVCHADDLGPYWYPMQAVRTAGYPVPESAKPTPEEFVLVGQMQSMLGSMAHNGNPGTGTAAAPLQYPPMRPPGQPAQFMNFSTPSHVVTDFRMDSVKVWQREGLIHY